MHNYGKSGFRVHSYFNQYNLVIFYIDTNMLKRVRTIQCHVVINSKVNAKQPDTQQYGRNREEGVLQEISQNPSVTLVIHSCFILKKVS